MKNIPLDVYEEITDILERLGHLTVEDAVATMLFAACMAGMNPRKITTNYYTIADLKEGLALAYSAAAIFREEMVKNQGSS